MNIHDLMIEKAKELQLLAQRSRERGHNEQAELYDQYLHKLVEKYNLKFNSRSEQQRITIEQGNSRKIEVNVANTETGGSQVVASGSKDINERVSSVNLTIRDSINVD